MGYVTQPPSDVVNAGAYLRSHVIPSVMAHVLPILDLVHVTNAPFGEKNVVDYRLVEMVAC